jgi:hypothetical protein
MNAVFFVPGTLGTVDLTRLDRVISCVIKGLFYVEKGRRLKDNYKVVNYSTAGLTEVPKPIALHVMANVAAAMQTPRVCSYTPKSDDASIEKTPGNNPKNLPLTRNKQLTTDAERSGEDPPNIRKPLVPS